MAEIVIRSVGPGRDFENIAKRFFAPEEQSYLLGLSPEERVHAFYRAWTRKEAYLKAIGTGLSFSSTRFSISYGRGEPAELLRTERPGDRPERWRMVDLNCPSGYAGAACWDGEALELRYFTAPHSGPPRER